MSVADGQVRAGDGLQPCLAELVALATDVRLRARHRRPLRSDQPGQRASRLAGRGMDHADSRPYAPGDEARHVDWRVSARSSQLYSKRFHAERERMCLVLADPHPAQFFGTRQRFKSVQAARVGAAAAWWAMGQGDRVGLLDSASNTPLLAGTGQAAVMRVLQGLVQAYRQPPALPAQPLSVHLEQAARLCRGGTLVLVADIARTAAVPASVWQACSRHLQLHVVSVFDVLELEPPRQALRLSADDGVQRVDFSRPALRQAWLAQYQQPLQALQALSGPRLKAHVVMTDEPADAWLPQPVPEVA